jgi:hypothetical protein
MISRRSPELLRAHQFVSLEIINDSLHAERGLFDGDFVLGNDIGSDLAYGLALFEAFPNNHRGLVELVIFLRIEIHEYSLAAVEIRNYYVFAWS